MTADPVMVGVCAVLYGNENVPGRAITRIMDVAESGDEWMEFVAAGSEVAHYFRVRDGIEDAISLAKTFYVDGYLDAPQLARVVEIVLGMRGCPSDR